MLPQNIIAEITCEAAPNRMDVVTAILHIVILEYEIHTLDSVIVRRPFFQAPHPCETEFFEINTLKISHRNLWAISSNNLF